MHVDGETADYEWAVNIFRVYQSKLSSNHFPQEVSFMGPFTLLIVKFPYFIMCTAVSGYTPIYLSLIRGDYFAVDRVRFIVISYNLINQ